MPVTSRKPRSSYYKKYSKKDTSSSSGSSSSGSSGGTTSGTTSTGQSYTYTAVAKPTTTTGTTSTGQDYTYTAYSGGIKPSGSSGGGGSSSGGTLTSSTTGTTSTGQDYTYSTYSGGVKPTSNSSPNTIQPRAIKPSNNKVDVVYDDAGVPSIKTGGSIPSGTGVTGDGSGINTAMRPYDIKRETSFRGKVSGFMSDYFNPSNAIERVRTSGQMTVGAGQYSGLNPIGGIKNLFQPFDRFMPEKRKGDDVVMNPVNQGTAPYDTSTKTFKDPTITKFDVMDEKTIANPDLLLPPNVAYQKDYTKEYRAKEDELKPVYEARAEEIGKGYQASIDSGSMNVTEAEKLFGGDMVNLNKEYGNEILEGMNFTGGKRYEESIAFRQEYADLAKDRAIQPSTVFTTGILLGGALAGGSVAIGVNTAVALGGASQAIDPTSTKTEKALGLAMFVGGTYGAMKLSANAVTQQQIYDVQSKTPYRTTFDRTPLGRGFQDDFSSYSSTSNAKMNTWGSSTYKYDAITKTYKVAGGRSANIVTTDYWTGKTLKVGSYQTYAGVGEKVDLGTLDFKNTPVKLSTQYSASEFRTGGINADNFKLSEVLTRVEFDTQYTSTQLGSSSPIISAGGASGSVNYGSYVLYDKSLGKVSSFTGSLDDVYFATSSTNTLQQFTGTSGASFKIQTSSISRTPEKGIMDWKNYNMESQGLIGSSVERATYNANNPLYARSSGTYISFKANPSNLNSIPFQYSGTQVLKSPASSSQVVYSPTQTITLSPQSTLMAGMDTAPALALAVPSLSIASPSLVTAFAPSLTLFNTPSMGSSSGNTFKTTTPTLTVTAFKSPSLIATAPAVTTTPTITSGSITKTIPALKSTPLSTTPMTTTPITPTGLVPSIGFSLPPFALGGLGLGGGSKKLKTRAKYGYTPSYNSLIKGITGKQTKGKVRGKFTGFEARPIQTKNWMFNMFKKKKKKKRSKK